MGWDLFDSIWPRLRRVRRQLMVLIAAVLVATTGFGKAAFNWVIWSRINYEQDKITPIIKDLTDQIQDMRPTTTSTTTP